MTKPIPESLTNEYLRWYLQLLEMEIKALRSVLSEYGSEHDGFTQWQKAQAIDALKNSLVRP
jgi:hypothetical protein